MKCMACGYLYYTDFEAEENNIQSIENGKEEFLNIQGKLLYEKPYGRLMEVRLFACPKCKTIQVNLPY